MRVYSSITVLLDRLLCRDHSDAKVRIYTSGFDEVPNQGCPRLNTSVVDIALKVKFFYAVIFKPQCNYEVSVFLVFYEL